MKNESTVKRTLEYWLGYSDALIDASRSSKDADVASKLLTEAKRALDNGRSVWLAE